MKAIAGLIIFCGLVATFPKGEVTKIDGVNKSVVCIKQEETLGLTIVQGENGRDGLRGWKGKRGERGPPGLNNVKKGMQGFTGNSGLEGEIGEMGEKGEMGWMGHPYSSGVDGDPGPKGYKGEPGIDGYPGLDGEDGRPGEPGEQGEPGEDGLPLLEEVKDLLIHALNDYQVKENGYYNKVYHVTSRELTDGRTDTGGWGSETAKTGNYIQATYLRPVYVTSVTVAGGYIPAWDQESNREKYGLLALEYSDDGYTWVKSFTFPAPVVKKMFTVDIRPVTAQYWRLRSINDKWVGTTEFALKPLIRA